MSVNIYLQAIKLLTDLSEVYVDVMTLAESAQIEGRDLNPQEILELNKDYNNSFSTLDRAIAQAIRNKKDTQDV